MTNPTKKCPRCGETKLRTDFSPRNSVCRPCASSRGMERYWGDPEYREKRKAWHKENERRKRADPAINAVILEKLRDKRKTNLEWRERTLAAVNARRHAFPGRNLAIDARGRAKEKGLPYSITREWCQELWDANPNCTYCEKPIRSARGQHAHDSATLDRITCEAGYTPENCVLCCFRCNSLKRDSTPEELERLAANIRRVRDERGRSPI